MAGGTVPPAPAVPASTWISARLKCVQGHSFFQLGPHAPHLSRTLRPLGTPAQSLHLFWPLQTCGRLPSIIVFFQKRVLHTNLGYACIAFKKQIKHVYFDKGRLPRVPPYVLTPHLSCLAAPPHTPTHTSRHAPHIHTHLRSRICSCCWRPRRMCRSGP